MSFKNYIKIDEQKNIISFKSLKNETSEIIIKLNDSRDVKDITLKKDLIQFFLCYEDFSNPLAAEFRIDIYLNNHIISYEVTGENKEEVKEFFIYLKSILI